jgi:hypothetical protein
MQPSISAEILAKRELTATLESPADARTRHRASWGRTEAKLKDRQKSSVVDSRVRDCRDPNGIVTIGQRDPQEGKRPEIDLVVRLRFLRALEHLHPALYNASAEM